MSLSNHVSGQSNKATLSHLARFVEINNDIPKFTMPEQALSGQVAASIIRSELRLDGNPNLNLASFVTTEIDSECYDLMMENLNKNLVDTSQYLHSSEIQDRCVNILANLFHAPPTDDENKPGAVGTATVGSSEAIMLGGLALKWRWRAKQAAKQGKKLDEITTRCNLIFSAAVHVSVLKLCRYFDIDPRIIPLEHGRYTFDIDEVIAQCDENTCGVLAILGTTLTGEFEDIKRLNTALLKLKKEKELDIPIHVDGASGAMVAPFVFPNLEWDFRLEQVRSINTSGHKYGLVLPGLGWIIWRRTEDLPEDLIFHVNYLGVDEPTFNLNFSRTAANVIGQYYQFLRLGVEGYKRIMQTSVDNAKYLAASLASMSEGLFIVHSQNDQPSLPMVAFSLNPAKNLKFNETTLVHWLRERSWIIPAYTLAANANDITVCRIVVRETFTRNIASILLEDIRLVLISLADHHGHQDLVESLKAARDDTHQHRRSNRHGQRVANFIQSNHEASTTHDDPEQVKKSGTKKKSGHHTMHVIC
jgi:glutamate decarboxylase